MDSSKHWPCLFPRHGAGHERVIALEAWQQRIAPHEYPDKLVRGLIHSDGTRVVNSVVHTVGGHPKRYEYPRYHFSNRSDDIKAIFLEACGRLGIEARPNSAAAISVARRESVAVLDRIVGPKR